MKERILYVVDASCRDEHEYEFYIHAGNPDLSIFTAICNDNCYEEALLTVGFVKIGTEYAFRDERVKSGTDFLEFSEVYYYLVEAGEGFQFSVFSWIRIMKETFGD